MPVTHADPDPDPHIPDIQANYCPNGGPRWMFAFTSCDGMPYADGSYWHLVKNYGGGTSSDYLSSSSWISPMRCVVNPSGGPLPQPAPPGGCDGAVP